MLKFFKNNLLTITDPFIKNNQQYSGETLINELKAHYPKKQENPINREKTRERDRESNVAPL